MKVFIFILSVFTSVPAFSDELTILRQQSVLTTPQGPYTRIALSEPRRPFMTPDGDVVFPVQVNPRSEPVVAAYILRTQDGQEIEIMREGSPLPDLPDRNFSKINEVVPGFHNELFLRLSTKDGSQQHRDGIWCLHDGILRPVLHPGTVLPSEASGGFPATARANAIERIFPVNTEPCASVIFAFPQIETPSYVYFPGTFFRSSPSQGLQVIQKLSGPAPGISGQFLSHESRESVVSKNGDLLYVAATSSTEGGPSSGSALYLYRNGTTQLVARTSQSAPGFSDRSITGIESVAIHTNGELAFAANTSRANYQNPEIVLYSNRGGGLNPLYIPGAPAPEAGPDFFHYEWGLGVLSGQMSKVYKYLDDGSLIFGNFLRRPGFVLGQTNASYAIWRYIGNQLTLLFDSAAPLLGPDGQVVPIIVYNMPSPVISDSGKIAIFNWTGSESPTGSVLITNIYGDFRILARTEQVLNQSGGLVIKELGHRKSNQPQICEINSQNQLMFPAVVQVPGAALRTDCTFVADSNSLRPLLVGLRPETASGQTFYSMGFSARDGNALSNNGRSAFVGFTVDAVDNPTQMSEMLLGTLIGEEGAICPADTDGSGELTLQDLFTFLSAWFDLRPSADMNHDSAVTVQDIFTYLSYYFAGCPRGLRVIPSNAESQFLKGMINASKGLK